MSFVDGSVVKLSEETRPPSVGKFSVPFPCKDLLSTAGSKGGMSSSVSLSLAFSFSVFLVAASFFSLFSSVVRSSVFSLVASFFSLFSSIVKSSVFSLVASFFSLFTSVVTFASFSERFNKLGPLSKALSVFDSTLLLFSEICWLPETLFSSTIFLVFKVSLVSVQSFSFSWEVLIKEPWKE